ncbi:hypothetical protein D3C71_1815310 [compost metagenome]
MDNWHGSVATDCCVSDIGSTAAHIDDERLVCDRLADVISQGSSAGFLEKLNLGKACVPRRLL